MVGQAVEQCGCHFRVNEDLWPFLEGQVRGDDHRGLLVEPADGLCHVWTWGHREVLFRGTLMAEAAPVIGAAN